MNWFEAVILALIEGLTEFLPVSSTGHMILGSAFMGIGEDDFTKLFIIVVQLGAILAVFVLYFKRFFQSIHFYLKLIAAFIPAAVLGVLFSESIDDLLESPLAVAISLVVGGVILLFVDKWFNKPRINDMEDMTYLDALKVGFFQCIAMIPGVSRSGATIVGGMSQKMSRKLAAEFSFFLAIMEP
jgi:undecaprenyl-diphosphatase